MPTAPVRGEIHLREAQAHDRTRIRELTLSAYREYATLMEPEAWAALEQALHGALSGDDGLTRLVAESDGVIVGSAALYEPGSDAYGDLASRAEWPEVRLVAVDPAVRGRGIARALVDECVRRARASGATRLGLHTSRSMTAAKRLYESMGFVREPTGDFQPTGAELVEGYRLELGHNAPTTES